MCGDVFFLFVCLIQGINQGINERPENELGKKNRKSKMMINDLCNKIDDNIKDAKNYYY